MTSSQERLIDTLDYAQIKQNFLRELSCASEGQPSSIPFLKYYLPANPLLNHGVVQGIVIGGTNYIVSLVEITSGGKLKILMKQEGTLPVFTSKQIFIDFIAKHLDKRADGIGINFGFPLIACTGTEGEIDGILLYGTKEHAFTDLTQPIGDLIKQLFYERYDKTPKVAVANDTVCLTLAGDGDEQAAVVAGTGFNMCIVIPEQDKKILVNLECGNFNKFTLSPILKQIDRRSENPGKQLFEKCISGQYLALYFNEARKDFSEISPIQTSKDLSELAQTDHTEAGDLARAILTRSAYLAAAAIAAVYEFIGTPEMLEIIGEGSLLWNGWQYQENIQKQLTEFKISPKKITIKNIPDSASSGAIGLITK